MKKRMKRIAACVCSAALAASLGITAVPQIASAATEHFNDASSASNDWETFKETWETLRNDYEYVSLTPGTDETSIGFAWYSQNEETPAVRIATNEEMTDAAEFSGTQVSVVDELEAAEVSITDYRKEKLEGYYSNKVTVTGLEEDTTYYYQVYQDGEWQEATVYKTGSTTEYSFLYVGDPQIGASKGQTTTEGDSLSSNSEDDTNLAARNDAYNWNNTLENAIAAHPNVSFMVSAGDQVNYSTYEEEYAGYLFSDVLSSLPVATTIGNHDSTSVQYTLHYNNPNAFDTDDETLSEYTEGATKAGTDYYYTYGSVLFIVLDTNNYNCATHENVIAKAIEENADCKWRIVMFHQDIYGSGYDHSDSDGMVLRTQLTPIFDDYDIDIVLQGHDHTYSRTYQLTGDGETHTSYDSSNYQEDTDFLNQNLCYSIKSGTVSGTVTNPEGTVYLEANSASGSKFYELIATQQDYISERSQTWTPSYSVIDVTEDSITVNTYDALTNAVLDGSSSYTIVKTDESTDTAGTTTGSTSETASKKAQTIKVTKKKATIKAAKLKKKKQTFKVKASASTKVTFEKVKGSKKLTINKNGKVTVKKGTKKNTYTMTVKATAAETSEYASASKTFKVKVTVK